MTLLKIPFWVCACQVYQLKADPCGHCLIINNITFSPDSGLSTRTGSDVDCERLEKRFKSLCFRVQTLRNLKAQVRVAERTQSNPPLWLGFGSRM